jgi:hypothetical protein
MLGRRTFLGTVGVGVTAAAAAVAATRTRGEGASVEMRDAPLANAGVVPGSRFRDCVVRSVEATADGAIGVRLADTRGQLFDLELLAHDPRTPGVARAGSLSVYMNNRGRGSTATVEEHGLAAMALARHLARREVAGAQLPVLQTLANRGKRADEVRA